MQGQAVLNSLALPTLQDGSGKRPGEDGPGGNWGTNSPTHLLRESTSPCRSTSACKGCPSPVSCCSHVSRLPSSSHW